MSDKAMIVTNIPKSCDECKLKSTVRGIQGITHACNLAEDMISLDKMFVERLANCPLMSLKEHDKEIRNKAIKDFCDFIHKKSEKNNGLYLSSETRSWTHRSIYDYFNNFKEEQMKEVEE